MRKVIIALSAAAMVATTPALARDFVVKHNDLNLQSTKGQKELSRRIDTAAREYCGIDRRQVGTRLRSKGTTDCYRDARTLAREEMNALISKSQLGG